MCGFVQNHLVLATHSFTQLLHPKVTENACLWNAWLLCEELDVLISVSPFAAWVMRHRSALLDIPVEQHMTFAKKHNAPIAAASVAAAAAAAGISLHRAQASQMSQGEVVLCVSYLVFFA
mmetsp:Transcript_32752/g.49493  ORF Transcript_32752/g.49493 Transcript_32752/m.49493 type:complete len:120 (+) Transcript_32752:364-723(+)